MTADIAILTPDPGDAHYQSRWREALALLAAPLRSAGGHVVDRCWTEAEDLHDFDLVLPLLSWGYHRAGPLWDEKVAQWEAAGVRLCNPPSVLRWNADKRYLGRLAEHGAPIVPTIFVDRLTEAALDDAAARFGSDRLVAKPQISAGAWQTMVWSPGKALDDGPAGAAMIQPYLKSIEDEGEVSIVVTGGRISHAIRKQPRAGDFRSQPEFGARITPHEPSADERGAADAILAAVDEPLLYARVDLIRSDDGEPLLMELELVEPDLYLGHDAGDGAHFAEAAMAAARR